jgi:hypothetical protein
MKIVGDVRHLSYFNKFGLRVTVEAGQALAVLYSEARLYKGPSLAGPSQSATTRYTGNISVWIKKVSGTVLHTSTRYYRVGTSHFYRILQGRYFTLLQDITR